MEIPKLKFFWQYVDYWGEKTPDLISIRYNETKITAKELMKKTNHLAKALLNLGVKKGDTIATVLPTIPEFIFTYIAASKIGAITIPMDKEYKKVDFQTLIPHSDPKLIVSINKWQKNKIANNLRDLSADWGDIKYIIVGKHDFGTPFEKIMAGEYPLDNELEEAKANQKENECVLVIWTGGTTGRPKAVELTHYNIVEMCYVEYHKIIGDVSKFVEDPAEIRHPKFLVNLPTSHVGGTVEIIGTGILGGMEMIMHASWSPWEALEAMQIYNLPFMGGVPTMFKILLSLPDLDAYEPKKYLKIAFLSGEKVPLELLQGIKERMCDNIVVGYGSTEAGSEVTWTEVGDDLEKLAKGYVGKAIEGMEIKVVDENGNPLPPNKEGEILIKGPLMSPSYFRMPEENQKGYSSDGYCITGDLGFLDETGGLWISGRIKQIIRVGGFTVFPTEIEDLVVKHPKISLAAALGAEDEIKGEVVYLVVGLELGMNFTEEDEREVLKLCQDNLAKYKVPQKIIVYPLNPNDLPITRIGKVDRVRLKKELLQN